MDTWLVQTKRAYDDVKREVTDQVRPGDSVSQTSVKSNRTSLSSSIASAKLRETIFVILLYAMCIYVNEFSFTVLC